MTVCLRGKSVRLAVVAVLISCVPAFHAAPSSDSGGHLGQLGSPHVINGVTTPIEKIPYQISLEFLRVHMCGGVIVSQTWALTAGHCIHNRVSEPMFLKRIRAGSSTQIPIIGFGGSIHQIADGVIHPSFVRRSLDYDIAVLKVSNEFELSPRVQPIPVPTETEQDFIDYKQSAIVSGYGTTTIGGIFSSIWLRSAEIPVIPRKNCEERLDSFPGLITPRIICAAGTGKSDSNKGDSGGPLVHKGQLIGIVSWSLRHIDRTLPSAFANVLNPEIREFIKNYTSV